MLHLRGLCLAAQKDQMTEWPGSVELRLQWIYCQNSAHQMFRCLLSTGLKKVFNEKMLVEYFPFINL